MRNLMMVLVGIFLSSSLYASEICRLELSRDGQSLVKVEHEVSGELTRSFLEREVDYHSQESYTISGYSVVNGSVPPYLAFMVKRIHSGTIHQKLIEFTKMNIENLSDYRIEKEGFYFVINCY